MGGTNVIGNDVEIASAIDAVRALSFARRIAPDRERGEGPSIADPTTRTQQFVRDSALAFGLVSLLNMHTVNDLRSEISERRLILRSGEQHGPAQCEAGRLPTNSYR